MAPSPTRRSSGGFARSRSPATTPSRNQGAEGNLELRKLTLGVSAAGVSERLLVRIHGVKLPSETSVGTPLGCTVFCGDQSLFKTGALDQLHRLTVEIRDGRGEAAIEVQPWIPGAQSLPKPERWSCRVCIHSKKNLFTKPVRAEATFAVPRPCGVVSLDTGGHIVVEVVRLAPAMLQGFLELSLGKELSAAVCEASTHGNLEKLHSLLEGAEELGQGKLPALESATALEVAARLGSEPAARALLNAGAPVTIAAVRSAEANMPSPCDETSKKVSDTSVSLALELFARLPKEDLPPWASKNVELARALEQKLPRLAGWIFNGNTSQLDCLNSSGAALAAYSASAWPVLAALLERGDDCPVEVHQLFAEALRMGEGDLAKVCLRLSGDADDLEGLGGGLHACLENGCTETVQEVMRTEWRRRSKRFPSNFSLGAVLPSLQLGDENADDFAECGICFEPFRSAGASVLCDDDGRVCTHLLCSSCVIGVAVRKNVTPICPFCRKTFTEAKMLPNPMTEPVAFYRLASQGETGSAFTVRRAADALSVFLPVQYDDLHERLQSRYETWCKDPVGELTETDFLERMWPWVSDMMLELKTEEQRGKPPSLTECPEGWFRHFDYDDCGYLTLFEVLRGCAKSTNIHVLAEADALGKELGSQRYHGARRLRGIVECCWDWNRWSTGISVRDFTDPGGLGFKLAARLPLTEGHRCGVPGFGPTYEI
uniref:RING-type domain-containing protein n=1 Tax=Noctiluca scintillans TaxID=2966 RepID=A0A7S1B0K9_NOCSC|mmetsp:Transcript_8238/g.22818  ORF Transcript_8238/g.22818 Transcript_8238/m.22818 type:complete len:716 (+) Transcript_8238:69-2216(+)